MVSTPSMHVKQNNAKPNHCPNFKGKVITCECPYFQEVYNSFFHWFGTWGCIYTCTNRFMAHIWSFDVCLNEGNQIYSGFLGHHIKTRSRLWRPHLCATLICLTGANYSLSFQVVVFTVCPTACLWKYKKKHSAFSKALTSKYPAIINNTERTEQLVTSTTAQCIWRFRLAIRIRLNHEGGYWRVKLSNI